MKYLAFYLIPLFFAACDTAPTLQLTGQAVPGIWEEYSVTVKSRDSLYTLAFDSLGHFSLEIPAEQAQFLLVSGVAGTDNRKWQFSTPFYGRPGKNELTLTLADESKAEFQVPEKDRNNRALLEYNRYYARVNKALWISPPENAGEAAKEINRLLTEAREIGRRFRVDRKVEDFLTAWSYLEYLNLCSAAQHTYSRREERTLLPAGTGELPDFSRVTDHDYLLLFYSAPRHIAEYLKTAGNRPEQQLERLKAEYQTPEIIATITGNILQHFVLNYDYNTDFDGGMERLEQMSRGFSGREKLLQSFAGKRFTLPGAPLPEVALEDREGNRILLSDLKGKYLYIDLWAYWCAPCCAEVPYLQKLEKELKNKAVSWVSISIDPNKEAWIKKMDELQMHGHQYIVADDALADQLNIRGIPHFLLYDKEGKLLEYKTLRPSSGLLREKLESLP